MLMPIDVARILPNPWQPRGKLDPAKIAELAENIKAKGLLSPPIGRLTKHNGPVELAFGHRRFAAWKLAKPGEPFPVDVQELTDLQMAEHAAAENGQREDLNPIERARGLRLLCSPPFNMTQAAAGKLYGLATQGAVSNAMRLLELPDSITDLVLEGKLIEKHARELVFMARVDPAKAMETAKAVVGESEDEGGDPAGELAGAMEAFLQKHAKIINRGLWPMDWVPMDVTIKPKGEPAYDAPACTGCFFLRRGRYSTYCGRPACLAAKAKAWAELEATRAAKKVGIARVRDGEHVAVIWDGGWGSDRQWALDMLAKKEKHLRIVPLPKPGNDGYALTEHLCSPVVALASTDLQMVEKRKKAQAAADQRSSYKPKTKEEQQAEQREIERRRKAASTLIDSAAKHLAATLPANAGTLLLLGKALSDYQTRDIFERIKKTAKVDVRRQLVMGLLLREHQKFTGWWAPDPNRVHAELATMAQACKVKLPVGWDAIPAELQPAPAANGKAGEPAGKGKAKPKRRSPNEIVRLLKARSHAKAKRKGKAKK
jgi:ParB/RepB/Spo0J family partition protein